MGMMPQCVVFQVCDWLRSLHLLTTLIGPMQAVGVSLCHKWSCYTNITRLLELCHVLTVARLRMFLFLLCCCCFTGSLACVVAKSETRCCSALFFSFIFNSIADAAWRRSWHDQEWSFFFSPSLSFSHLLLSSFLIARIKVSQFCRDNLSVVPLHPVDLHKRQLHEN